MKAKEYFEKYARPIINDFAGRKTDILEAMIAELYNETIDKIQESKSKTDSTVIGICRQQCQKYDRITEMFEDQYGRIILKKDGFKKILVKRIPELEGRI